MKNSLSRRVLTVSAGVVALALPLAACSAGGGGDASDGGKTEITYLTQSDDANANAAKALIEAFEKANPTSRSKLETQPAGTEGDNLMKTKLSTGAMEDVFHYNSGSLLAGAEPRPDARRLSATRSGSSTLDRRLQDGRLDRQRSLRRAVGHLVGRCGALQQEDLRRARTRGADDVG